MRGYFFSCNGVTPTFALLGIFMFGEIFPLIIDIAANSTTVEMHEYLTSFDQAR